MSEWQTLTIADLGKVVTGSTPPSRNPGWFGDVTPFVTPSDMTEGDRRPRPERFLSEEGRTGLRTRLVPQDAVAFVCIASIGKVCLLPSQSVTNQQINTVVPGEGTDGRFLYYLLKHLAPTIAQFASGAATPIINKSTFSNVLVRVPDYASQCRIGEVLGCFDDLIENNRRRIEVLEDMAQAIYREWFVKFRYAGHGDVPIVDSVLGPIPEGWDVRPFSSVVDYHIGGGWGTGQKEAGSEQPGYVIRGTDIPRVAKSDVSTVPFRFHGESKLRSRKLKHGDIVLEISGGSKGQPVGRSFLVRQQLLDGFDAPAMCASFCKLVRIDPTVVEPSLLIRMLQNAYSNGQLDTYQVQSTGITNFKWKPFLEHFRLALPPRRQQEEMVRTFDRLDDLIANAGRKVAALAHIRDMLLPKLVTGQIDVSTLDLDALIAEKVA